MNRLLALGVSAGAALLLWACGSAEPGTMSLDLMDGGGDIGKPDGTDVALELPLDLRNMDGIAPDLADLVPGEVEVDVAPRICDPGACPCETNGDCDSGFCVETGDGKICTSSCFEECPPGFICTQTWGVGTDIMFACLPIMAYQCRPCTTDDDCNEPGMKLTTRCVGFGPSGSFCTIPCQDGGDCGDKYQCAEKQFNDGPGLVCIPLEGDECQCNAAAKKAAASTACFAQNEAGTCTGTRSCGISGLSDCDAQTPTAETCNGTDDDCNGKTDEDLGEATCGLGECEHTVDNCQEGAPTACDPLEGAAEEACDGLDNDCDGIVDNGFPDTDLNGKADCLDEDDDGDGIPDVQDNCPQVQNPAQENLDLDMQGDACDPDDDNDGAADTDDCGPLDKSVFPGALEVCNGKDDDCDQFTDEDLGQTTCGLGACKHTVDNCNGGKPAACDPLLGASEETCDDLDKDCDGNTDEPDAQGCQKHYVDIDGDAYGADAMAKCTCGPYDLYTVTEAGDCQPLDKAIHPGALESCDGVDQDCSGQADDGLGTTTCGLGPCGHTIPNCEDGDLQVCDPMEGALPEECDGLDNDCNGATDDGLGDTTCGLGVCTHTVVNCFGGLTQECDPLAGTAPELCDHLDNDCNGDVDDGLGQTTCGLGVCEHTVENCVAGVPQQCDPFQGKQAEKCDGLDNDCNGEVDEGSTCSVPVAPLATIKANLHSIWDIDFDAAGNTYLTSYISGMDFMKVITPQGNVSTLNGISDWNMGYGEVKPDGSVQLVSYGYWGSTGIGIYQGGTFKLVIPITPTTCNVAHNSGGYDLYAPIDPVWGYDGYFYAGGMAGTGDLSRFTETGNQTTVATFAGCVNALDATPDKLLFIGEGKNLHRLDLDAGDKKLLESFSAIIFSLATWAKGQKVYVETYDSTVWELDLATGLLVEKWKLSGHGFLEVGPDNALYRVVGIVNGQSTLERYEL